MAQDIIVGLIVAAAVLYVAWRYLPRRWRSRLGAVHPALAGPAGCGGCDSCGSGEGTGGAGGCSTQPARRRAAMRLCSRWSSTRPRRAGRTTGTQRSRARARAAATPEFS